MSVCFQFEAIGTHWQIELASLISKEQEEALLSQIHDRIESFEKIFSRFREDSMVAKIARVAGTYELPPEAEALLTRYRLMYERTGGIVTPLIGRVLVEAGYDPAYSLQPKTLHVPPEWDDVMAYHAPFLTVHLPVQLDFGAAGKGYLVDLVGELLEAAGILTYTINAGGDIRYRAEDPQASLRIGLEHPTDPSQVIGVVTLKPGQSICGSAGNRRAWGEFHHIINPKTLTSPQKILSVWVVAEKTLLADALTTGLFFVQAEQLLLEDQCSYLILFDDYSVERSPDFPAELFLA